MTPPRRSLGGFLPTECEQSEAAAVIPGAEVPQGKPPMFERGRIDQLAGRAAGVRCLSTCRFRRALGEV